jgi:hypothetical protein
MGLQSLDLMKLLQRRGSFLKEEEFLDQMYGYEFLRKRLGASAGWEEGWRPELASTIWVETRFFPVGKRSLQ